MASFPDVPEALTEADTRDEALAWAADALHVALTGYVDDHRDIPQPSPPAKNAPTVALTPRVAIKLAIYQAMRQQGLSQNELARRMGCDPRQVRRILDLDHNSRLDFLERAVKALGKSLVIAVRDAA